MLLGELICREEIGQSGHLEAAAFERDDLGGGDRGLKRQLDSIVQIARPEDVVKLMSHLKLLAAEAEAFQDVGIVGVAFVDPLWTGGQVRADEAQAGRTHLHRRCDGPLIPHD